MILQFPHKKRINGFGVAPENKFAQKGQRVASVGSFAQNLTSGQTHCASVEMSIPLMLAVWQLEIPSTEKFVLMALADYANNDAICWPCMGTLAKKCGMGKATARRAVASLESKGLLYRDHRTGHANKYHIKVTPLKSGGVSKKPHSSIAPPRQKAADYSAQSERQNLSSNLPRTLGEILSVKKSEADKYISPETQAELDKLFRSA